jgi:hypothetical protein
VRGREEWQPYIAAWQERRRREAAERGRRAQAGRAATLECAQPLAEQYGVRRVWLFGSLAHRLPQVLRTLQARLASFLDFLDTVDEEARGG